jgi:hypothetical protein
MGTFVGHAVPGSVFIFFGLWHVLQSFRRFFHCKQRNTCFTSSITYPCDCLCGRLKELPVEGAVKVLVVILGSAGEIVTATGKDRSVIVLNAQHASVYFFFGISGVIDLLVHYGAPLPPDVDFAIAVLAFLVEALLFQLQMYSQTAVGELVHRLLVYTVVANAVAVAMQMKYRHSLLGPLATAFFLIVQGSWFWYIAFILYSPIPGAAPWVGSDYSELSQVALFFVWDCAVVFILILMFGASIACCYRRRSGNQDEGIGMKRLIHTGANGQTFVALNDDSDLDSDVEFQRSPSSRMR